MKQITEQALWSRCSCPSSQGDPPFPAIQVTPPREMHYGQGISLQAASQSSYLLTVISSRQRR